MSGVLTVGGLLLAFYDQLAIVGVDLRELVGHFVATERVGTVMTAIGVTVVILRLLVQWLMKKD